MQARRDLQAASSRLMETGEVATNASPSGRSSETPTDSPDLGDPHARIDLAWPT